MIHPDCIAAITDLLAAEAMRLHQQADKAHKDRRYRAHEKVLRRQAHGLNTAVAVLRRVVREQVGG